MEITSIGSLSGVSTYDANKKSSSTKSSNVDTFSNLLQSAVNMLNETNELSKKANEAKINFAMGKGENTHDLAIAQQKALLSIQYTVAVRDAVMEAYKEIMNLQF